VNSEIFEGLHNLHPLAIDVDEAIDEALQYPEDQDHLLCLSQVEDQVVALAPALHILNLCAVG